MSMQRPMPSQEVQDAHRRRSPSARQLGPVSEVSDCWSHQLKKNQPVIATLAKPRRRGAHKRARHRQRGAVGAGERDRERRGHVGADGRRELSRRRLRAGCQQRGVACAALPAAAAGRRQDGDVAGLRPHTRRSSPGLRNPTCVLSHLHSRGPVPVLQTGVPWLDFGRSGEPCTNHQVDVVVQLLCLGARGQAEQYAIAPASCSIWLASGTAPKHLKHGEVV